jgi:Zn-dependent protease with chaperone function
MPLEMLVAGGVVTRRAPVAGGGQSFGTDAGTFKEVEVAAFRKFLSLGLIWLLAVQTSRGVQAGALDQIAPPPVAAGNADPVQSSGPPSIDELVKASSIEIAAWAEQFTLDRNAINAKVEGLKQERKSRANAFKAATKSAEKEVEQKEKELEILRNDNQETNANRKRILCEIARIRKDVTEKTFDFLQSEIADDVALSKLELAVAWKSESQQIERKVANGTITERRFGDVINIGHRTTRDPFKGQGDDQAWGKKELDEARASKLFPQIIKDPVVREYVNRLANNLALNSDLQVPLNTYVVQQELKKDGRPVLGKDGQPEQVANAMALPGGFLIIYAGIILESETESELAGVISHEMAHCAARHAHRMQSKGRTFGIIQLATSIGLSIFAPGLFQAASYLGYYLKGLLLQGIFQGMGLIFTMNVLGVSREFELEADQLGMQYASKSGYDPEGFIRLFDHMSKKEGHASSTSFFATHPAYGDRVQNALKEYKALSATDRPDRSFITDASEFQQVKERLRKSLQKTEKEIHQEIEKPSLNRSEPSPEECDEILKCAPRVAHIRRGGSFMYAPR